MVNPFAFSLLAVLSISPAVEAKDFGTHGPISVIEEKDLLEEIQDKLHLMEERGDLEAHQQNLQKQTQVSVERPTPVKDITKAQKERTFYYNPTYTLTQDIKDHRGTLLYQKGTRINPLETVSLPGDLLFIDGDDLEQQEWALALLQGSSNKAKVILIKGAPLVLSKQWDTAVYFDQGGRLTSKLQIKHIPARVSQEGKQLRIEEINLKQKGKG